MTEAFPYADLAILVRWMADSTEFAYTPDQIACAVEKPWNYKDELAAAKGDEVAAARVRRQG